MISFCRNKNAIRYDYYLGDDMLNRTSLVYDHGVLLDDKLTVNQHFESKVARAILAYLL